MWKPSPLLFSEMSSSNNVTEVAGLTLNPSAPLRTAALPMTLVLSDSLCTCRPSTSLYSKRSSLKATALPRETNAP